MATTKIWPIHDSLKRVLDYAENPDKTGYLGLRQVLEYAENEDKTGETDELETCYHITGINCRVATAYEEMAAVKQRFGKTGGNQAYHAYQSFKPGEVTPQECHEIGVNLARTLWGDRFQIIVTTHMDKHHLHNHIVLNSVSFRDGKKFNDNKAAYAEMRRISDSYCRAHGLSVIEKPGGKTPRAIYFAEKNGEPTRYNLMRQAIDRALNERHCLYPNQLRQALAEEGYVLEASETRKYATLRSIHGSKPVRLYRLGENYDIPALYRRLEENRYDCQMDWGFEPFIPTRPRLQPKVYRMKGSFAKSKKIGGLRALYLQWCYLLGIFPNWHKRKPLSPEMRQELRKLDQYTREFDLIHRYKLYAVEQVQTFVSEQKVKLKELTDQRDRFSNQLRYLTDPEEAASRRTLRDSLTKQAKHIRKEIATAEAILTGVEDKRRKIAIEQSMMQGPARTERKKGVKQYEER